MDVRRNLLYADFPATKSIVGGPPSVEIEPDALDVEVSCVQACCSPQEVALSLPVDAAAVPARRVPTRIAPAGLGRSAADADYIQLGISKCDFELPALLFVAKAGLRSRSDLHDFAL